MTIAGDVSVKCCFTSFRLTVETSAAAFPEFNLDEFKSSCLNNSTGGGQQPNKSNDVILPASSSMPTIPVIKSPPAANIINSSKSYVFSASLYGQSVVLRFFHFHFRTTPTNIPPSIPSSISFPAHLQQMSTQFKSMNALPNVPSQPSTAFNTNFMNGFGGPNPMGNTSNRVLMNQMNAMQQNAAAPPTMGNNLLSFNSSNNNSNSTKTGTTDKAVALSAQEINDFLN